MERDLIDLGHGPFVELQTHIALNPGEGVLLAHGHQHVIAKVVLVRFARGHQLATALFVELGLHHLEDHPGQLAVLVGEFFGDAEVEDRNILMDRVFLFPRAGLHFLKARANDHLDLFAAQPARGAATVHGGVAPAQHDHAATDLAHMLERHRRQPVDADMDIGRSLSPARQVQVPATRCARADEDRVITLADQRLEAVDPLAQTHVQALTGDVAHLFVDHFLRQTKPRNLAADHAASLGIGVVNHQVIAQRC